MSVVVRLADNDPVLVVALARLLVPRLSYQPPPYSFLGRRSANFTDQISLEESAMIFIKVFYLFFYEKYSR
ncbi:MAG: hypothetical protein ACM37W_01585 [Actinomycetota bacterium]